MSKHGYDKEDHLSAESLLSTPSRRSHSRANLLIKEGGGMVVILLFVLHRRA